MREGERKKKLQNEKLKRGGEGGLYRVGEGGVKDRASLRGRRPDLDRWLGEGQGLGI